MNKQNLRYAILKEVDSGNNKLTEIDFSVEEEVFDEAVRYLDREGYLSGLFYADNRPWMFGGAAFITGKGETYLSDNSTWGKAYRGMKEIRDWLK